MSERDNDIVDFTTFVLHRLSEHWGKPVPDVYAALDGVGIVDDYLIKCYDVLHTLGADYLVNDVTELARNRGVVA